MSNNARKHSPTQRERYIQRHGRGHALVGCQLDAQLRAYIHTHIRARIREALYYVQHTTYVRMRHTKAGYTHTHYTTYVLSWKELQKCRQHVFTNARSSSSRRCEINHRTLRLRRYTTTTSPSSPLSSSPLSVKMAQLSHPKISYKCE